MNAAANIAAAITINLAALIGQRRATTRRRNQAATTVNGFTLAPGSYLMRAANGVHGPEAQRAARRELAELAWFEQQMRDVS